jgi:hypothetical protein
LSFYEPVILEEEPFVGSYVYKWFSMF